MSRTGFGGMHADILALRAYDWPDLVARVLDTSTATSPSVGVPAFDNENGYHDWVDMTWFWLDRCRSSHAPLVEKMVLFWHGHFCSSLAKVFKHRWLFDQNQLFRTHGLGGFEDLTQRMAVQPAMLAYLDNDRNVAGSPNDNFARECMELFTLGVGNYSEDDVLESARAWTGHLISDAGGYRFTPEAHDWGTKTFFGDTRNWDGPQIIDHIINGPKKMTVARFIGAKLWSFLAYPDPEDSVVDHVATAFANADMHIAKLVEAILLHPQFRSAKAKRGLIRSPIEYVVATMRQTGLPCSEANPQWALKAMGQQPYYPPNVSGWRQNGYWVNEAAAWAKSRYVSGLRWSMYQRGDLVGVDDLSPSDAATAALEHVGIMVPSARTHAVLEEYVRNERLHNGWADRAGLLLLPLLTPEFQVA
ncbi:MAG: DUF1800 domain-containing protein [Actinomycetota bacterium]